MLYKFLGALILFLVALPVCLFAQKDTLPKKDTLPIDVRRDTIPAQVQPDSVPVAVQPEDTVLRITNLNPYITLHVDSTLYYKLDINKDPSSYYWFLRNAPVGLKIDKDNGMLTFKADKSFFLSGRLKYDNNYKVSVGVQNLKNPREKVDTFFTLLFYSTEILPSRVKPTVNDLVFIDEGDTLDFKVQCDVGSFPIETISMLSSIPLKNYRQVNRCDDEFVWVAPYDFIKEGDTARQRLLTLRFIGVNKFQNRDTATVRVYVRNALNYPLRIDEYNKTVKDVKFYILQLKYAFMELDKKVRKTKNTRTGFDLASGSTALGGTIFTTQSNKTMGTILPSVGVALVPVKEAVSPAKTYEQNSASLVRTSIRRLEYSLGDNVLLGERDPEILLKSKKLKDDMKQIQVQLIDIPTLDTANLSEEELNSYFNSPKVNKKYKVTKN